MPITLDRNVCTMRRNSFRDDHQVSDLIIKCKLIQVIDLFTKYSKTCSCQVQTHIVMKIKLYNIS